MCITALFCFLGALQPALLQIPVIPQPAGCAREKLAAVPWALILSCYITLRLRVNGLRGMPRWCFKLVGLYQLCGVQRTSNVSEISDDTALHLSHLSHCTQWSTSTSRHVADASSCDTGVMFDAAAPIDIEVFYCTISPLMRISQPARPKTYLKRTPCMHWLMSTGPPIRS